MSLRKYFAYIRVSTLQQGEGVSLHEQRDAINRYAQTHGLSIVQWFEELQTAAKGGRPVFTAMLKLLRNGGADGVLMHKIDRSARNLKDWAELGEFLDQGVDVRFVNEDLDLHSRGGRLAANIQAVIAADYIWNLREETRKGFYGRLKQGLYPLPAPLGYLDRGGGRPKEPDPERAPLVRLAFELYASGEYSLTMLAEQLYRRGLRNRSGGYVGVNRLSYLLHNPFYAGVIYLRLTKESFPGIHPPLASKDLFDRVQDVLQGRVSARTRKHDFAFRQLISCATCGRHLVGERQKGHVYYRCHTRSCPLTSIREEALDHASRAFLRAISPTDQELDAIRGEIQAAFAPNSQRDDQAQTLALRLGQIKQALQRLTDAYIDGLLDKGTYAERRRGLLMDQRGLEEERARLDHHITPEDVSAVFELFRSALHLYSMALPAERRELLRCFSSNRTVQGKSVEISPVPLLRECFNGGGVLFGAPSRDTIRTNESGAVTGNQTHSRNAPRWVSDVISWLRNKTPELQSTLLGYQGSPVETRSKNAAA